MSRFKATVTLVVVGFLWGVVARETLARPAFRKIFAETYEKEYAGTGERFDSCTVCHFESERKSRYNHYAEALAESLRGKNWMDERMVVEALRETEKKRSAIPGKTYGDLIREGLLPGDGRK